MFSVEDVKQQLSLLGFRDVPDEVLTKFVARLRSNGGNMLNDRDVDNPYTPENKHPIQTEQYQSPSFSPPSPVPVAVPSKAKKKKKKSKITSNRVRYSRKGSKIARETIVPKKTLKDLIPYPKSARSRNPTNQVPPQAQADKENPQQEQGAVFAPVGQNLVRYHANKILADSTQNHLQDKLDNFFPDEEGSHALEFKSPSGPKSNNLVQVISSHPIQPHTARPSRRPLSPLYTTRSEAHLSCATRNTGSPLGSSISPSYSQAVLTSRRPASASSQRRLQRSGAKTSRTRRNDPVARYHALKRGWDNDRFLRRRSRRVRR